MIFNFTPSLHTSLLAIAAILLVYALLLKDKYAHLVALVMIVFELGRYLLLFPTERLHMSLDLLIIGGIGISCLISRYRILKFALALIGFVALFGLHYQDFTSTATISSASPETKQILLTLDGDGKMKVDTDMELMVQFDNHTNLQAWLGDNGQNYEVTYPLFTPLDKSFLLDEYIGVNVTEDQNLNSAIDDLRHTIGVLNVELNELVQLDQQPILATDKLVNDAQLDRQWVSKPFELEDYHRLVKSRNATSTQSPTVIAILDTGVDGTHEDLKSNYLTTSGRYDKDKKGHGTHCAGIAAAVTGNNLGIASLLPPSSPVKVTGIKVLGDRGIGTQKMIIDGIIEAADRGYSVISMSLGGMTNDKREAAYRSVVEYATAKGAIVVTAAGNSSRDARQHSPANTPGVIAVAAVGPDGKLSSFSNTVDGLEMGIAAPGVKIFSTIPGDAYESYNGTSMATPFVSGLIGLMKHFDPSLTTKQVYVLLNSNADTSNGIPVINPLKTLEAFFTSLDPASAE